MKIPSGRMVFLSHIASNYFDVKPKRREFIANYTIYLAVYTR